MDPSLHQIQTIIPVGLHLSDGLGVDVGVALLDALGARVATTELGDEFG